MFLNGMSVLQPIAAELTLSEKGIAAAKVILTGFVVVFSVLLLLIGDNDNGLGISCDTLIWLLLLSRFCGGENGCGCGNQNRPCGCSAM